MEFGDDWSFEREKLELIGIDLAKLPERPRGQAWRREDGESGFKMDET